MAKEIGRNVRSQFPCLKSLKFKEVDVVDRLFKCWFLIPKVLKNPWIPVTPMKPLIL